ncbi:hypothetical protein RyT2_07940 [Pseudolactococcus yaeyamensis]
MNGVFKDLAEKGLVPVAVIFSGWYIVTKGIGKQDWGKIVGIVGGNILLIGFIYFPDVFKTIAKIVMGFLQKAFETVLGG